MVSLSLFLSLSLSHTPKQIFQLIQQGPSYTVDNLDPVLFTDAKLQEKVMSYCFSTVFTLLQQQEVQYLSTP